MVACSSSATPLTSCRRTAGSVATPASTTRTTLRGSSRGQCVATRAPGCSSTYEHERRPVGRLTVEQAYTRYVTRTATYLDATDYEPLAPGPRDRGRLPLPVRRRSSRTRTPTAPCTQTRARRGAGPDRELRISGSSAAASGCRRWICSAARSSSSWEPTGSSGVTRRSSSGIEAHRVGGDVIDRRRTVHRRLRRRPLGRGARAPRWLRRVAIARARSTIRRRRSPSAMRRALVL